MFGEEAEAEISRALTEETPDKGGMKPEPPDKDALCDECLRVIRIAQMRAAFEEHRLRADAMEREGNSNFLQELQKSQRIKQEIDQLNNLRQRMDE